MKKILVPSDFSGPSREAFKLAINIASKTNGEVTVLHTLYSPALYDSPYVDGTTFAYQPAFLAEMEENAKKEFNKMKSESAVPSVKTNFDIIHGNIISSIKQVIQSRKIGLVIMGTAGASGLQEVFIGSNTEKVVRHSPVPVIAVRTAPEIATIRKILLPSLLTADQDEFMDKVKELQDFFNAELHVILVNTPLRFRRDATAKAVLEGFVKNYKLRDYSLHFVNDWSEEEGIVNFAHEHKMDLIAMATHSRKGLAHLFSGSITEEVVNHIQYPVWTYTLKP